MAVEVSQLRHPFVRCSRDQALTTTRRKVRTTISKHTGAFGRQINLNGLWATIRVLLAVGYTIHHRRGASFAQWYRAEIWAIRIKRIDDTRCKLGLDDERTEIMLRSVLDGLLRQCLVERVGTCPTEIVGRGDMVRVRDGLCGGWRGIEGDFGDVDTCV